MRQIGNAAFEIFVDVELDVLFIFFRHSVKVTTINTVKANEKS